MKLSKVLIVIIILIILASPAQLVFGQPGKEKDKTNNQEDPNVTNNTEPNGTTPIEDDTTAAAAPAARNENRNDNKPNKKPNSLTPDTFDGRFIDFEHILADSKLQFVSVYDVGLFDQLYIENSTFEDQKVLNHLFKGDGIGASLKALDNPLALIQLKAKTDLTVHLNVSSNWTIQQQESNVTLHNESINVSLRLLGKPGSEFLSISDQNITVHLIKSSKLHVHIINLSDIKDKSERPGVFWFAENSPAVFTGVDSGYYGGDVTITGQSGSPAIEVYTYIEDLVMEVTDFDTNNHEISLKASSPEPSGKFVMVSSLKDTLGLPDDSEVEVEVYLDGKLLQPEGSASSLRQGSIGYYRVDDAEAEQVLISVPYFSEHEITLRFIPMEKENDILKNILTHWDIFAIIGILIVVIIAGLHLFITRRND